MKGATRGRKLTKTEIKRLLSNTSLEKLRLDYEKVGELPAGFEFDLNPPSGFSHLRHNVRSFVNRIAKLDVPGERPHRRTVGNK